MLSGQDITCRCRKIFRSFLEDPSYFTAKRECYIIWGKFHEILQPPRNLGGQNFVCKFNIGFRISKSILHNVAIYRPVNSRLVRYGHDISSVRSTLKIEPNLTTHLGHLTGGDKDPTRDV